MPHTDQRCAACVLLSVLCADDASLQQLFLKDGLRVDIWQAAKQASRMALGGACVQEKASIHQCYVRPNAAPCGTRPCAAMTLCCWHGMHAMHAMHGLT